MGVAFAPGNAVAGIEPPHPRAYGIAAHLMSN